MVEMLAPTLCGFYSHCLQQNLAVEFIGFAICIVCIVFVITSHHKVVT